MATVILATTLSKWLAAGTPATGELRLQAAGRTLRAVLDEVFASHPILRGYVLDDAGALRHHVAVFVDGQAARDKRHLGDPIDDDAEVFVAQALSGG